MSTDESKKPRGPRRSKAEIIREKELYVLRGRSEGTLAAIKKLDRAYTTFGEAVNAAAGDLRATEAFEKADIGPDILKLRAALVSLLPEAIQPKPDEPALFAEEASS